MNKNSVIDTTEIVLGVHPKDEKHFLRPCYFNIENSKVKFFCDLENAYEINGSAKVLYESAANVQRIGHAVKCDNKNYIVSLSQNARIYITKLKRLNVISVQQILDWEKEFVAQQKTDYALRQENDLLVENIFDF